MNLLKVALLSGSVFAASLNASAADFNFDGTPGGTTDTPYDFGTLTAGTGSVAVTDNYYSSGASNTTFSDLFVFTLVSDASVTFTMTAGPDFEITLLQINNSRYNPGGNTNIAEDSSDPYSVTASLVAGNYELALVGNLPAGTEFFSEAYSGSVQVVTAAVPEPATEAEVAGASALLLACGFGRRRRVGRREFEEDASARI